MYDVSSHKGMLHCKHRTEEKNVCSAYVAVLPCCQIRHIILWLSPSVTSTSVHQPAMMAMRLSTLWYPFDACIDQSHGLCDCGKAGKQGRQADRQASNLLLMQLLWFAASLSLTLPSQSSTQANITGEHVCQSALLQASKTVTASLQLLIRQTASLAAGCCCAMPCQDSPQEFTLK